MKIITSSVDHVAIPPLNEGLNSSVIKQIFFYSFFTFKYDQNLILIWDESYIFRIF